MKKIVFRSLICLLALSCLLSSCTQDNNISVEPGESVFGSFSATDMDGNIVDQTIFSNCKLTMINIWATFCSPCINEMPDLAVLHEAYGDDFQIIGIPIDVIDRNSQVVEEKKNEAERIISTTGANYTHIIPSVSLNKAYLSGVQSVPETIFVDSTGRQVGVSYLGAKSREQWSNIIEAMLESLQ